MNDVCSLVLRIGFVGLAVPLTLALLFAVESDEQKVVPIGYPPGFEEGKREAEGRRQEEEAKAKRVPSGAEEQVTEPAQEQREPLPGKKERGE